MARHNEFWHPDPQIDIKDVRTGRKVTKKCKPTETFEAITLEKVDLEVQYVMDDLVFMMN